MLLSSLRLSLSPPRLRTSLRPLPFSSSSSSSSPPPRPTKRPNKLVIGLCGGIASGKSTAARHLSSRGVASHVNADLLATYPRGSGLYEGIVAEFGQGIVGADGEVDRRKLGAVVFADGEKMKALTGLVWPAVGERVERDIEGSDADVVVLEAAVLGEAGWDERLCDEVWRVAVDEEVAVERVMERDRCGEDVARGRVEAQRGKIGDGDVVLDNGGDDMEDFLRRVEQEMDRVRQDFGFG